MTRPGLDFCGRPVTRHPNGGLQRVAPWPSEMGAEYIYTRPPPAHTSPVMRAANHDRSSIVASGKHGALGSESGTLVSRRVQHMQPLVCMPANEVDGGTVVAGVAKLNAFDILMTNRTESIHMLLGIGYGT